MDQQISLSKEKSKVSLNSVNRRPSSGKSPVTSDQYN
jgi:hypothetical protein